MAAIVSVPSIVAQKSHGIALYNMLRVRPSEVLDAIPDGGNSVYVFVKTEYKTVLLPVVSHELEGIIVDIAIQLDTRFHSPIPFKLIHQRMAVEKARLVSAHVPVAHRVSIYDLSFRHVFSNFPRSVLVNELWI